MWKMCTEPEHEWGVFEAPNTGGGSQEWEEQSDEPPLEGFFLFSCPDATNIRSVFLKLCFHDFFSYRQRFWAL